MPPRGRTTPVKPKSSANLVCSLPPPRNDLGRREHGIGGLPELQTVALQRPRDPLDHLRAVALVGQARGRHLGEPADGLETISPQLGGERNPETQDGDVGIPIAQLVAVGITPLLEILHAQGVDGLGEPTHQRGISGEGLEVSVTDTVLGEAQEESCSGGVLLCHVKLQSFVS